MKNKKTLIILILAFVVLLGGAYILYSQLGQSQTPDQLSVEQQESNETEENQKTLAPACPEIEDYWLSYKVMQLNLFSVSIINCEIRC